MTLLPIRRIVAVALVLIVTLSMGLSVVHASDMSVEMAFSSAMGPSGHDRCQSCAYDEADGIKAMPCAAAACVAFAMLPQAGPAAPAGAAAILSLPEDDLLLGSTTRPDPYPPRSSNIG